MQDAPDPPELLNVVSRFLREEVTSASSARTAFMARVAANAVDLARRQIELQPGFDSKEHARLAALLKREGTLEELNRALCDGIEGGTVTAGTAGLSGHLWAATLEKLAVDQPSYAAYVKRMQSRG